MSSSRCPRLLGRCAAGALLGLLAALPLSAQIVLLPPQTTPLGKGVADVTLGRLDGDAHLDVLVSPARTLETLFLPLASLAAPEAGVPRDG